MSKPELSIVVPILNERAELPEFMAFLQRQEQVDFELLLVDGGSQDGGPEWVTNKIQQEAIAGTVLSVSAGRGRQLNLGARQATADWLLFLHVDSRLADRFALRKALDRLQQTGSQQVAGHFALKFRRVDQTPSLGYYFYEWKARLGRPETIHGDQGFLLHSELFVRLEGFREDMPVMEDTDLAERLREQGQWLLFPEEISTSARRFEVEGLWQRQLLGALIMCFRDVGWTAFFRAAPTVYRQQSDTEQLQVRPFFRLVRKLLDELAMSRACYQWWLCGIYVRKHAWQLLFALDVLRAFKSQLPVGQSEPQLTRTLEPLYDFITDNAFGRTAAAGLLRIWFEITDIWLRYKETRT